MNTRGGGAAVVLQDPNSVLRNSRVSADGGGIAVVAGSQNTVRQNEIRGALDLGRHGVNAEDNI